MLYKELIELFDILDSASASGSEVVEYLKAINPRCQAETYPLAGPNGHTDMVRILIPGKNGKSKGGSAGTIGICLGRRRCTDSTRSSCKTSENADKRRFP